MRVFTASLATETNTFAPLPTDLRSFEEAGLYPPGAHPDGPTLTTSPLWVLRRRAAAEGIDLVEGTCAWAEPAGLPPPHRRAGCDRRSRVRERSAASPPAPRAGDLGAGGTARSRSRQGSPSWW
jgi:microcystin degradation protein MlrC